MTEFSCNPTTATMSVYTSDFILYILEHSRRENWNTEVEQPEQ